MALNILKKLTLDSRREDYDAVAHLPVDSLFKIEEDAYEQIMLNMQEWYPSFKAIYIHPGTDLFTLQGSGTMLVTETATE